MKVQEKIDIVRNKMQVAGADAYIVPTSDPHMSEYTADHWKTRKFLSGFTGSAGTLLITKNMAGLWTDSRYFLQAEKELRNTGIELFKSGMPDVPTYIEYLSDILGPGKKIAFDGRVMTYGEVKRLQDMLNLSTPDILFGNDLTADIWQSRPEIPKNKIYLRNPEFSGLHPKEKISNVRDEMKLENADFHIIGMLDEIAWLLDIRGSDIPYNPVAVSFLIIGKNSAELFIDSDKLTEATRQHLINCNISTANYEDFYSRLAELKGTVMLDPNRTNYTANRILGNAYVSIVERLDPAFEFKSRKNKVETAGMRAAHIRDGLAMVRFQKWLEENVGKIHIDEISAAEKLYSFRSQGDFFVGESFAPIVGYRANGAIVHYSATPESAAEIFDDGFLLIDSGAQYQDGTTDITRMYYLGDKPTEAEKADYTNVLKGNIALTKAVFPEGTRGSQLDVLARQFLWRSGKNYMHGTGHGVGSFLNVHEGPQSIRQEENPSVLKEGMVLSNEPGVYCEGKYGIRIENLICIEKDTDTPADNYLRFDVLTMVPVDTKPVNFDMLDDAEIYALNNYHKRVKEELSPYLTDEENEYLAVKTKPISRKQ